MLRCLFLTGQVLRSSMTWHSSNNASICVYIFAVTTCLGLFGFSSSTSEPTEREQWFGSIDCPKVLSARWNELLSRPPYVERKDNSTSLFGGLFPGKVSHDLPVSPSFYWCNTIFLIISIQGNQTTKFKQNACKMLSPVFPERFVANL